MTHKTQPTAHAEITAPISADLRGIDDAGAQPAPALQPEALRIAMHLRQRAQLSRPGNLDTLSAAGANELERQHAELSTVQSEAKHWRSNHDNVVARLRIFTQRPDIPKELADRLPWYRELVRLQAAEAQAAANGLHQGADAAAVAALKGLLSLVRREAPQLSGKVLGDAESAIAALQAAPAQAVPSGMWTIWEALPGYLIDHCEGDIISEEGLQRALEAMLKDPKYSMPPAVATQVPKAAGTAHLPYFSYDEDAGVQFWATQERAIKECQDAIDAYREDVEDGWPDDVESVRWGVVLGRTVKTDERPDGSCDYALTPYDAPAQEHATQLAGQCGEQDDGLAQAIDERDTVEGWADGLAALIGAYFGQDIGEHSSAHNPWQEAKDIIEEAEPYRSAAAPAQAQEDAPVVRAGLLAAAAHIRAKASAHAEECGSYDPDTGAFEMRDAVQDHYNTLDELAEEIRLMADKAAPASCDKPPAGWACSRAPGHVGPCAAACAAQGEA